MSKLKAAWLSRHAPTPAQRACLSQYTIVQVNPPGRFWSPVDALMSSQRLCGGKPDLYVVVMPLAMLRNFVPLAGNVPVIQARMHKLDGISGYNCRSCAYSVA